MAKFSNTYTDL